MAGKETIEREFGAFKPISDASPKYVFSLDRFDYSRDGIAHINIVDFLLGKKDIEHFSELFEKMQRIKDKIGMFHEI